MYSHELIRLSVIGGCIDNLIVEELEVLSLYDCRHAVTIG